MSDSTSASTSHAANNDPARGTRYYRGLTHASIRRPIGTLAIASIVLVMGLFFIDRLPVNLLPEVEFPLIRVTVNYPGVSPEVMEEQVTRVLERSLSSVENLSQLSSRASEGRSNVNLIFEHGVDLDVALQNTARALESARQRLPADIEPPRVRKWDPGEWSVWRAGFSSPVRPPREVRDWVEQRLVPQLQSIQGVAAVEAAGGQVREIEVVLDQDRLRSYGLTLRDVADQLAAENVNVAAGNITSPQFDVMARTDGRFGSPEAIAELLLTVPGSERRIRLSEVGEVRDGFREQRLFVRLNGTPATQLSIFKLPDANVVQVVDAINDRMDQLLRSGFMPADIQFSPTRDGAFFCSRVGPSGDRCGHTGCGLGHAGGAGLSGVTAQKFCHWAVNSAGHFVHLFSVGLRRFDVECHQPWWSGTGCGAVARQRHRYAGERVPPSGSFGQRL